jgi:hypothetical protein
MSRDEEIRARRYRRRKKWFNSLTPEQQRLDPVIIQQMKDAGFADENGLTPAGELRLHQLELLEWMVNHPRK